MTSISDMIQNNFTHQEIHEIFSNGVSGAEMLFVLVERVYLFAFLTMTGALRC